MPTIGTTYKGESWDKIRVQLAYAFDAANGRVNVEGNIYPRVTNAQALAILQAWRGLLTAWKQPSTALWPEIWYLALGRFREGEKFNMTTEHGLASAPDIVVAGTWEFVAHAAERLDGVNAQPLLLVLNFSYSGYREAARDAWAVLKRAPKAKTKIPMPPGVDPPDVDPPESPVEPPPPPSLPGVDKAGLVLVVLLLVALAARRRN